MFKGMQRGLLCVCLLALLVAPATYAGSSGSEASPLDSASLFVSDILGEVWEGLNVLWNSAFGNHYAHDGYEADETAVPPSEEGDGNDGGASTQSAAGDPPPPPAGENDDDGNIGGGSDPWG